MPYIYDFALDLLKHLLSGSLETKFADLGLKYIHFSSVQLLSCV